MTDPSIFKAYDIRGVYPTQLDEESAYRIGRAFVRFLRCKNVCIGRDMRTSSDSLFKSLARGINEEGADVIDIGRCTTPMLYFCVGKYSYDSGIMLTASHNPGEYNGFKLTKKQAVPISGATGIEDIKKIALSDLEPSGKTANIIKKDFMDDYKEHVMQFNNITQPLKIVIDYGNGMGRYEVDNVISKIDNLNIIEMFKEPDGNFPNHEANPLKPENLEAVKKKVLEEKADLGLAYDGDCDRVGFIDDKGETVNGDTITALISKVMLKKHPNATILYDLRSSKAVKEAIEEAGGKAVKCRVGHAFIKKEMRDNDAVFAGELSSHFYFRNHFFTESSTEAILTILSLLSEKDEKISQLASPLRKYFQSGEINSEVEDKQAKMKELEEHYNDADISWLDGITVEYKDWWFNVRPSNTEPLLRLNLEADSEKLMEEKKKEVLGIIQS
ncbi:phosphomannomutase/phosphoglucomutase [Candidatus Woesearchaeota archaeon]|nr:phosphomannomutase/phosphoglucomutase [Candidatus Woesearchaeota archaeon]